MSSAKNTKTPMVNEVEHVERVARSTNSVGRPTVPQWYRWRSLAIVEEREMNRPVEVRFEQILEWWCCLCHCSSDSQRRDRNRWCWGTSRERKERNTMYTVEHGWNDRRLDEQRSNTKDDHRPDCDGLVSTEQMRTVGVPMHWPQSEDGRSARDEQHRHGWFIERDLLFHRPSRRRTIVDRWNEMFPSFVDIERRDIWETKRRMNLNQNYRAKHEDKSMDPTFCKRVRMISSSVSRSKGATDFGTAMTKVSILPRWNICRPGSAVKCRTLVSSFSPDKTKWT